MAGKDTNSWDSSADGHSHWGMIVKTNIWLRIETSDRRDLSILQSHLN